MKKTTIVIGSICFILACVVYFPTQQKSEEIYYLEYGSTFDAKKELDIPKEASDLSVDVDTFVPGTYVVQWKEKDKTISKSVVVSDTKNPKIELVQNTKEIKKIHINEEFVLEGNIQSIFDDCDGDIHSVEVVDEKTFVTTRSAAAKKYLEENKKVYTSDEDVQNYKAKKKIYESALLYTDLDTTTVGTYVIKVMAIDKSFLTSVVEYSIEVVAENSPIQENELAAGAKGSQMGELAIQLVSLRDGLASIVPDDTYYEVDESYGNEFIEAPITTTNNAVANAALDKQGQQLTSEQLVTNALVDAGKITGNTSSMEAIEAIYFPGLSTAISENQLKPGDIIYYDDAGFGSAHVAIYIGSNQAVHGGFEGNSVKISHVKLAYASSPRYYRFTSKMTWDEINAYIRNNQ
ncbi:MULTISPECIES: NlpC/P60 family protein [unclassified Breznakia]|uniref:NlpC/P60 family protein n=1 Tax=unclassified Breznakia TaxID=2623764 RepID=UPI002475CEF6|nr:MULTISPECIES: NlpC/P60 family protein [unclassified Breznakia]MDH6367494.1 hypothetical protein [Breznakia sp. PH1-1]MDH6404614.1 hypothetical protein [Breznakia sp. PF1-11]MDH6412323.1 hypothetical protein [Breznakia sp. PFB1-11]MDH6414661.1 hypothetical protein [Breznakia sp. PFB1-14]MDH6416944.1 hypothetical protein [Breznakia sp. PFB1-4]